MSSEKTNKIRVILFSLILVFFCIVLDQSTKFHAEKSFLVYSHPTDVKSFENSKYRVHTWGVSPSIAFENTEKIENISDNWCDFFLTYTRNTGAAWSAFSNLPDNVRRPLFLIVTLIAIAAIGWMFYASERSQKIHRLGLLLILSGALGNLIDRIVLGYVIDFIQFHWKILGWEYSFPVFNVADVCINIGVVLIIIDLARGEIELRRKNKTGA